jgi:exopolysaccharide biosynthesis polyprenyl glycosylphosphotransferase
MKSSISFIYNLCLVVGDFLALVLAFVGAYILRVSLSDDPFPNQIPSETYLGIFLTLLPFWILIFALLGLYTTSIYEKRFSEFGRLAVGSFIGFLFVIFWNFVTVDPIFPAKLVPVYGLILAFLFLVLFRTIARMIRTMLFRFNIGITHVLVVGNTQMAAELVDSLSNSKRSGYNVIGVVGDKRRSIPADFGTFEEAIEVLKGDVPIHGIIQTELYPDEIRNQEILEYAQTHHISYRFVPGNTELFVGNIDVELFRSSVPVINVHQTALLGWGRVIKRLFDLLIGSCILIVASPLILVVAVLNAMTNRGKVFFRQTRLTRYNQEFKVFKFRTQYAKYDGTTPEEAFEMMGRPELAEAYRANGDQLDNDPRVTPLGNFLRATSLDELPQLFNVIRGDLSLVGPRALIPQELAIYNKRHAILSVKSGITGLAQVSGRRNIPFEERRKLDLYYVQNWSFWLDIIILFKTIRIVIDRTGAK